MSTSRRDFLQMTAAASGAALTLGVLPRGLSAAERAKIEPADKPLKILVLGGTGFTGPHQIEYALARGHAVTTFNRGRTRPELFKGRVEQLIGDRDTGQLDALKGRDWDVVIDNPTSIPSWVRDVGQILKGHTNQYIFISTISVYADTSKPGFDETTPLAQYKGADAMKETRQTLRENIEALYGPLKALSEKEAEKWFPGKTTIIRPGYIVGPLDGSDRWSYWALRVDRAGEILAPGDPSFPVQFIDGRDLAEWTVRMAENNSTGQYNATGPASPLSMAEMLYGMRAAVDGTKEIKFTWVDTDFLEAQKVAIGGDLPIWIPPTGEYVGFHQVSIKRALDKGLTFRPLATTTHDLIEWFRTLPADRQAAMRVGLKPEREKEVLAAWHARTK